MQPLQLFSIIFPDHRLIPLPDELRYLFVSDYLARIYEGVATQLIIKKGLPLTTEVQTWSSRGCVREVAMVVKEVPEEYAVERMCADECQDGEGLDRDYVRREDDEY